MDLVRSQRVSGMARAIAAAMKASGLPVQAVDQAEDLGVQRCFSKRRVSSINKRFLKAKKRVAKIQRVF